MGQPESYMDAFNSLCTMGRLHLTGKIPTRPPLPGRDAFALPAPGTSHAALAGGASSSMLSVPEEDADDDDDDDDADDDAADDDDHSSNVNAVNAVAFCLVGASQNCVCEVFQ
eukprot:3838785-Amphidinium_carterae.1